ncbi:MAG: hypothetical protein KGO81_13575 [Bacteroidota bacterium]|nr:hypothetical protein [Bacteroidota bacterium]
MSTILTEGIDFYYDANGYMVLTEKYHLEKGYCCGHGCRHCPFNYENVPEPKKSELLNSLKTDKGLPSSENK